MKAAKTDILESIALVSSINPKVRVYNRSLYKGTRRRLMR